MALEDIDPKGLIRESYRIDGISASECRSIFLDWAIGVPQDKLLAELLEQLLAEYGTNAPAHPMTLLLRDGLGEAAKTGRRGGRKARLAP